MSTVTVELDIDMVDSIVVQELKRQYSNFTDNLDCRLNDKQIYGIFSSDKEEDIAEIQRHLDAIETVLSLYMTHTDFEEWKNG